MTDPFTPPGQTPEDAARQEGRRAIGAAILRMAQAAGEQLHERPSRPGGSFMIPEPGPAAGIRYALMLRGAADFEVGQYIRRAREAGLTWRQVGEILNPALWAAEDGADLAVMAFEHATGAAHAEPFATLSLGWDCAACGRIVSDRGPYENHPLDNEHGHAEGCERLAAAIAEHDARWADE